MGAEVSDAAFLELELPSYRHAATVPEISPEFRGIRIAGPKRLTAGAILRIPVSAVARFGPETRDLPSPFWNAVAAVVVEVESNRCWVGSLMDPYRVPITRPTGNEEAEADSGAAAAGRPAAGPSPANEDDAVPEASAEAVATRCAHVDLRELLELPPTPGSYEISLTYGPWASNAVHVVVERPREGE